jgi:hypothetical protein
LGDTYKVPCSEKAVRKTLTWEVRRGNYYCFQNDSATAHSVSTSLDALSLGIILNENAAAALLFSYFLRLSPHPTRYARD